MSSFVFVVVYKRGYQKREKTYNTKPFAHYHFRADGFFIFYFLTMEWYIKLHRETMFSEIWSKPAEWYKIWSWILLNARYENWNENIPKWCVLTNYDYISQQTFIKKRVIENCMRWLKESGMVVVHKRTRLVLIEVKNWDDYQSGSGTQTEHKRNTNGDEGDTIIQERRKKKEEIVSKETELKLKPVTQDINNLIQEIKTVCDEYWLAYDKTQERNFARHILTAKEFWNFAEKVNMNRVQLAKNLVVLSQKWYKSCAWPKDIYQNYAKCYNDCKNKSQKIGKEIVDIPEEDIF